MNPSPRFPALPSVPESPSAAKPGDYHNSLGQGPHVHECGKDTFRGLR
ncbi:uncharacterized protein FFNC_08294 [Fusarium fujikuroi]|nr:uncharacterized protein FFNC_08294 [Fusarium fujikuroi]SCV32672.1 uncharacterized protein FFFS_03408 [Fusarium fujikuroi]